MTAQISRSPDAQSRERTTVLGVLDWAYRRQLAHLHGEEGFGLRLGSPRDSIDKLRAMKGVLGCQIDGGEWKEIGHRVHADAAAVVDAVSCLPDFTRNLVHLHAAAGTQPDWGEICRVWPERNEENGKAVVASHDVTITDRRGRTSIISVRYCPFTIFPPIDLVREEYRMWHRGLVVLRSLLNGLRRWEVVEIGVDPTPWIAKSP